MGQKTSKRKHLQRSGKVMEGHSRKDISNRVECASNTAPTSSVTDMLKWMESLGGESQNSLKTLRPDTMGGKATDCSPNPATKTPPGPIRMEESNRVPTFVPTPGPSWPHRPDKTYLKQPELLTIKNPKKALGHALQLLGMDDWEKTVKGMNIVNSLAQSHRDILVPHLPEICHTIILEVMDLRSCVSKAAVSTVGNLCTQLEKKMDPLLEVTATALLQKVGNTNGFLRQEIDAALDSMVRNCSANLVLKALLPGGLRYRKNKVRQCASQHLFSLVKRMDTAWLLSDTTGVTDCVLPAAAQLALDASQEVRYFGRQVLLCMAPQPDFEKMVRKYVPKQDIALIRNIVKKAQGFAGTPPSSPSCSAKAKRYSIAQREEYIQAMEVQMASKDVNKRIEAIDRIVADCTEKPELVVACKFQVFDAIVGRLQESNQKVNQHTLEALQAIIPLLKDSLPQVLNMLVPAIADNHLNSKILAIHDAADGALNSLIQHLDNPLLLEVLCTKAQFLSGKATGLLIDKLAVMVTGLYPRRPQSVEQKVLPLLWKQLLMILRSCVSKAAESTVRNSCTQLEKKMDPLLEVTATALLQKVGNTNGFLRQEIDAALDSMDQNCSANLVLKAPLGGGLRGKSKSNLNLSMVGWPRQHLDNALLLEVLCTKAQYLSGKAKGLLIDKLAGMVADLYPRQPQTKVLPLPWKQLSEQGLQHFVV